MIIKQIDSCVLKKQKPILQKTNPKENNMTNMVRIIKS